MKLFKFEVTKLWRQRKLVGLFFIILLVIGGVFTQNLLQKEKTQDRAILEMQRYAYKTDELYAKLNALYREEAMDAEQEKQYDHSNQMATALFKWKSAIFNNEWADIPTYEGDFLTNLIAFEEAGGEFDILQGTVKEKVISKNKWMLTHQLPYTDEQYPLSPALVLKESSSYLFGALGLFILMLFFGNTITVEKIQHTWSTLKTQPLRQSQIIMAKFASIVLVILVYIGLVVTAGLAIPLLFGEETLNLSYPQLLANGDNFTLLATSTYLLRGGILFLGAALFAFSLHFLVSMWIKHSFGALMVTGLLLISGFFVTTLYSPLQSAFNPFYLLHIAEIQTTLPGNSDVLFPLSALTWSIILLVMAIRIPAIEFFHTGLSDHKKPFRKGKTKTTSRPIWAIHTLEWRKMRRNGLFKQLVVIFILFIIFGYFLLNQQAKNKEMAYFEEMIYEAEYNTYESASSMRESIERFEQELQAAEEAEDQFLINQYTDQIEKLEKMIDSFWEELEHVKTVIAAYKANDWQTLQAHQLNSVEHTQSIYSETEGTKKISPFSFEVSIAEKEWLMTHNIQPVFAGNFIPTIYDEWHDEPESQKDWEKRNRKVDASGLFSLYFYFTHYFYLIPILLFLFLVGGGLASEKGKKPTIRLLKTQPITEQAILFGKGIQATFFMLFSSLGLILVVVGTGTLFNRFGDWDYPVLRYVSKKFMETTEYTGIRTFEGGGHFVALGDYLIDNFVLFLCATLFLLSLSLLLSVFLNHPMTVLGTTLLLSIIGYLLSEQGLVDQAHLSPFMYLNLPKVVNGEFSALLNNPNLTLQTGVFVLLGCTFLFTIISSIWLKRKNKL